MFSYLMVRAILFIIADYHWYEKIVAFLLLCAEGFLLVHGLGYFFYILHVLTHPAATAGIAGPIPPLKSYPPVAIIVSSFKEPLAVVEDTLTCFYNLTYPNKNLFFLDDTRYDLPRDDPREMAALPATNRRPVPASGGEPVPPTMAGGQGRHDQ